MLQMHVTHLEKGGLLTRRMMDPLYVQKVVWRQVVIATPVLTGDWSCGRMVMVWTEVLNRYPGCQQKRETITKGNVAQKEVQRTAMKENIHFLYAGNGLMSKVGICNYLNN